MHRFGPHGNESCGSAWRFCGYSATQLGMGKMILSLSVYSLLIEIMGSSEDANVCSCDGQNHFLLSMNTWMGVEYQVHFNCYEERIRIYADSGV